MSALSAVEGELGRVLGGVFLGGIGIGVVDLCGSAGKGCHERVEGVEEDRAGDSGEDVAVWWRVSTCGF